MDYADTLRDGALSTKMRGYLVEGEMTAVTMRIPRNREIQRRKPSYLEARASRRSSGNA